MRKILLVSILFSFFGSLANAQTPKTKKETTTAKSEIPTLKKLPTSGNTQSELEEKEAKAKATKANDLRKQQEEAQKSTEIPVPALIRKSN